MYLNKQELKHEVQANKLKLFQLQKVDIHRLFLVYKEKKIEISAAICSRKKAKIQIHQGWLDFIISGIK